MITRYKLGLTLPIVLGSFAIVITVFAYMINVLTIEERVSKQKKYEAASTLNMMQSIYERLVKEEKWSEIRSIASTLASRPDIENVVATSSDGTILTSFSHSDLYKNWAQTGLNLESEYIDEVTRKRTTTIHDHPDNSLLEGYTSLCPSTNALTATTPECGFIYIKINPRIDIARETASLQQQATITGLGISFIASLLWLFIHKLVTERTRHLVNVLDGFVKGHRGTKANLSGNDEIAHLGNAIDESLDAIEKQEIRLQEKEAFQRAVMDSASKYGILALGKDGRVTFANKYMEKLTGYSMEEIFTGATNPGDWHLIEEMEEASKQLSKELGRQVEPGAELFFAKPLAGQTYEAEWTLVQKSGKHVPISLILNPVKDSCGEVAGIMGMATDISLRKQAEQAIKDSEQRVRAVLNAANDVIITTDAKGMITSCNPAVHHLLGYHPSELQNRSIDTILANAALFHDTEDPISEHIDENLDFNPVYEVVCIAKHGEELPIELSISHYFIGDNYYHTGIFRDISERKKQEQEIIDAMGRAEQANRAKTAFLATMSHEIRTPLNGMLGMAQILNGTQLDQKQKDYVEIILNSGNTLLRQINDILDLSKIEADKIEIEETTFNFAETCESAIQLMQGNASDKGVGLEMTFSCVPPEVVIGDSYRIRQILLNLIGNAIKFTSKGKVELEIDCRPSDENYSHIIFRVKDTGIGIAEEKLAQLFNPFTQADQSTTRKYGGSGLGLSICKRLANLMNADLRVESEYGKGTTVIFEIDLEIGESPVDIKPRLTTTPDSRFNGKVLLVEDNETNLLVARSMLTKMGIDVVSVGNGQQAIDAFNSDTFDLILMDCQMPVLDGYQATQVIRKTGSKIPILALTANVFNEDIQRCHEAGMDDCIHKPIDNQKLRDKLAEYLDFNGSSITIDDTPDIQREHNSRAEGIDTGLLDTLRKSMGNMFQQLIPAYLEDTEKYFQQIDDLLDEQKYRDLERIAHSLKSSSRNVGASSLGDIAERMEHALKEDRVDLFASLRPEAERLFSSARKQLLEYNRQDLEAS